MIEIPPEPDCEKVSIIKVNQNSPEMRSRLMNAFAKKPEIIGLKGILEAQKELA